MWQRYDAELGELKDKILRAFRTEQELGEGTFQFVFYPELEPEHAGMGGIARFLSRLIAEDDVSPEHRKVIELCRAQLSRRDFSKVGRLEHEPTGCILTCAPLQHPYYPLPMAQWKALGLPQCQTLLSNKVLEVSRLSIDFKVSATVQQLNRY